VREIWNKSIDIIKRNITQQNFETWIQPLEIVSLQENNAYLSVPNKFFKDWLSENYTPVIKDPYRP
jgi:chromosomal replication initiator protein